MTYLLLFAIMALMVHGLVMPRLRRNEEVALASFQLSILNRLEFVCQSRDPTLNIVTVQTPRVSGKFRTLPLEILIKRNNTTVRSFLVVENRVSVDGKQIAPDPNYGYVWLKNGLDAAVEDIKPL